MNSTDDPVPTDPGAPTDGTRLASAHRPPTDVSSRPRWRDRLGMVLLYVCAAGAVFAAGAAVSTVLDAGPDTRAVETWRLVGYGYFAGVFVLLAHAPRRLKGLWELTIAAKLALPVAGLTFLRGSDDADTFVVADGVVVALLVAAYVAMSGWRSQRVRSSASVSRDQT